jgi:hypothetical protein
METFPGYWLKDVIDRSAEPGIPGKIRTGARAV